ncbi:MAG: hypothetical protein EOP50_00180 [Sphingobacteriales bacterium]|nr:MAG: hypothetical protein EOP50_00180 [Sphingobacteriales bacterium]
MALFDVTPLQIQAEPSAGGGIGLSSDPGAGAGALHQVLGLLDTTSTIHWVSDGDWSMHQLLEELLMRMGPSEALISSYAFSELPARKLADLKASGAITRLSCIIDSRVDVRSASALSILTNVSDRLKLCQTHAKVTILRNSVGAVAIVIGSANYTTNKRYEAGLLSTDPEVAGFHAKWIEDELLRAQ